ncbi:Uma2 family endonuclease [Nocardia bovistercoris]|uniref:Uma2 family endonuclease n=1 Tax=Nocardia bovistercoris TaxID=2785916 RepID=A0A931IAS0_9NOCA|nr:Uma2 family endonuclease [Nocardia bovistercoris]MBH0777909.1 Uma2 family endonuclease [Nocardia bovistercoris]
MSAPDEQQVLHVTAEEFADGATADLGDLEIVDGRVIRLMAQSPLHSRVVRRLAGMLEAARRDGGPCMIIDSDVAARFADTESNTADRRLNVRYPDIWIRDCEPYDVNSVRDHILLVVEVTSESTIDTDISDKRIQYAAAGIPRYLIVRLDQKEERIEEIEEYRLDWSGRRYRAHAVHRRVLLLDEPVEATVPFGVLEQP